jgi:hypothetical protein
MTTVASALRGLSSAPGSACASSITRAGRKRASTVRAAAARAAEVTSRATQKPFSPATIVMSVTPHSAP